MPDANLADAVRRAASADPAAPALIVVRPGRDEVISWGEIDRAVDAVAAGLHCLDLAPSRGAAARVALVLPNVPEFAYGYFGALRAGLVTVPLNPGLTQRELRHAIADSSASVVIAAEPAATNLDGIRPELGELRHVFVVGGPAAAARTAARPLPELTSRVSDGPGPGGVGSAEDLAVLLYTSGSTGTPKAAMLSHRALIANHRQLERVNPRIVGPADVVLLALPLFHAFGLNAGLGAVAWHGACGVLVERFDPAETLAAIGRTRASVLAGVPQMFGAWADLPGAGERTASVRVAVSGAAALEPAIARRFHSATGHPVLEGYGLTETAPVLCTALASPAPKTGSIGRPIPDVEIRLVAVDGSLIAQVGPDGLVSAEALGEEFGDSDFHDDAGGVPGTDPGEIVARGPNLFSGYWPDGAAGPDAEGWWHTGDIAYADADGDLYLVDRLGELIIVSGFNVYPREVEQVLAAHPGVAEAAAVGISDPDTGQAVMAYVVPAPGTPVTEQELAEHCSRNLARFKCPAAFKLVEALPHSATGKVRKNLLHPGPA